MEIWITCVLVSTGVSTVDVVWLVDWDGVDRGMVDWSRGSVSRDMDMGRGLDRDMDRGRSLDRDMNM